MLAVFAVILPCNSSFGVHVQRCTQLPSSWILKASGSSVTESEPSKVNVKRKSMFTRRLAADSTNTVDKPVETDVIIVTKAVSNYDNMTVLSLKEILRERGLQVSGLKDELKLRLRLDDSKYCKHTCTSHFYLLLFRSEMISRREMTPSPCIISNNFLNRGQ